MVITYKHQNLSRSLYPRYAFNQKVPLNKMNNIIT